MNEKKVIETKSAKKYGVIRPPPKKSSGWKLTNPRGQNCRRARCECTTSELESIRRPPDFRWILYGESIFRSPTPTAKSGGPTPSKSRTKRTKNFLGGVPKKVKDPPHQKVEISHVRKFSSRYPSTRRSRCRSLTKKLSWGKKLPC